MAESEKKKKHDYTAIVHSHRNNILATIRTVLRMLGFSDDRMISGLSVEETVSAVQAATRGIVILDWEAGVADVMRVVKGAQSEFRVDEPPVILIAAQMAPEILSFAAEMGIAKAHTGDITAIAMKLLVQELLDEVEQADALRDILRDVTKLRKAGDHKSALSRLRSEYIKQNHSARLGVELAECLMHQGEWEASLKVLEPIASQEPPDCRAIHLLGRCFLKSNRHSDAIRALERARLINPYNVDRLVALGNAYLKIDRTNEATSAFDDALSIDPEDVGANQGKGTLMLLDGELNEGLKLIREISSPRELASIFNTAAVLTIRRGEHGQAINLYDAAIRSVGEERSVLSLLYYNKGIGYHKWQKPKDAEACFATALDLDAANANAQHNLDLMRGKKAGAPAFKKTGTGGAVPSVLGFQNQFDESMEVDEETLF